ncbi:hypothetical protein BGZ63DRAFT_393472 [Mariannaea sp. PMI_226]|nr:hypothetical protein BGZ63DRAFT_393472 [Mariannaea sp. PMI_226]
MAVDSAGWTFVWRPTRLRSFFLIGLNLLASSARAAVDGIDQRCPDYVADYAPLIWLHSDDPYMPSDLLTHILHTTPYLDGQPIPDLPALDLDNLEILNEFKGRVALTSNDDPTSTPFPEWLLGETPDETGRIHNSTACVVILVEKNELDVDAFYFYFYSYNEGANLTQVLEPFDRIASGGQESSMHFGNHVGDWEHNMVRFHNGTPVGIYYSQHMDGAAYNWDDSKLSKTDDGRPIVYSARGSHANYATPGDQVHNVALVDWCDEGRRWDPVLSAYFYHFDPASSVLTRLIAPNEHSTSEPASNLTSFFYFQGIWGDTQYPSSDPRQKTTPRFGLKRFESGPTGPQYKRLVRKGLKPDNLRKLGWIEWGAGIYMFFYPCCLKGWRAWVSTGFIIVVLSLTVIGVRYILGRMRGKISAYQKVPVEDIPLTEMRADYDDIFSSSDDDSDDDSD